MKKTLSLIVALILCLSFVSCSGEDNSTIPPAETETSTSLNQTEDTETSTSLVQTETAEVKTSPKDSIFNVGDTAEGTLCNVTVTSVEFVDKIENGFLEHMWIPETRDTYKDVTAEEGYSIVKIEYHFDYTGKASGNIQLKFELDYDDGYIYEGVAGHAVPKKSSSITYGFEEKYVFGEQTSFVINDPLSFQGKDAFTYIFVNDAAKNNTDKSFLLRITLPTTTVSDTYAGISNEELEYLLMGIPYIPDETNEANNETETVIFNLRKN